MSEPQSSHEIEDVVSSIRRLVSTQLRPRTRDLSHDKLLLTPALQVVAEVDGPYEPEAIATPTPAAFVQPVTEEVQPQAEVPVAAVAEPIEQGVPVVADVAVADLVAADVAVEEAALVEVAIADAASAEAALAEEVAQIVAAEGTAEVTAEVFEPTADAPRDSADSVAPADLGDDAVVSAKEVSAEAGFAQSDPLQSDVYETPAEPPVQEQAEASNATLQLVDGEWEDEIWEEVEPSFAELNGEIDDAEVLPPKTEAEVHRLDPWPVPETETETETGPVASSAPPEAAWAQEEPIPFFAHPRSSPVANDAVAAPAPAEADLRHAMPTAASAEDPNAGLARDEQLSVGAAEALDDDAEASGYSTIDEDVLTEIIRDLIREELQGALGERITRNVRKLVRAEINRALTSRPYE